jgi:hypothetical protein
VKVLPVAIALCGNTVKLVSFELAVSMAVELASPAALVFADPSLA